LSFGDRSAQRPDAERSLGTCNVSGRVHERMPAVFVRSGPRFDQTASLGISQQVDASHKDIRKLVVSRMRGGDPIEEILDRGTARP
jgi:hypothetical protein